MTRRATTAILALFALAACGRKGARSADFDSATAAALAGSNASTPVLSQLPKVAHVAGFDLGHQLDKNDMLFGGPTQRFAQGDSVLISVRGQFLAAGADVSARIRLKNSTIDSAGAKAKAADSTGFSFVGLRFATSKKWTKGTYQADIFLDGKFQMSQDFQVVQ